MARRLFECLPNATILITIRNQVDIAKSLYARWYDNVIQGRVPHKSMEQWFNEGGGEYSSSI